jgi:2'-5' RNA ligase
VTELALVVPFDDLAPVVDELREQTCVTKPSHGMPPHVTLLAPCPGDAADDEAAIAETLRPFPAFTVRFAQVDRFPGTLWLAPEPAERFVRMTEALAARFPAFPPYGGLYANIVPHLTVAQSGFDEAIRTAGAWLPLRARAERAVLFEQSAPDRWVERARFELGVGA